MEDVMIWGEASVFFPLLIGYIFYNMKDKNRKGLRLNDVFNTK